MQTNSHFGVRTACFALFCFSGFSGLIYESIWTHYIKLFLGHAAYAQTLVLIIFMGGLAIGSWLASKLSTRWRNLLIVYAIVEGLIGALGLLFHTVFVAVTDFSYSTVIASLSSPAAVQAWKWGVSGALLFPQSVLLGMTFPLMSGGIVRRWTATPGNAIATLYFSNSIGAAVGVLVAGFVLVSSFGLPGTMLTASLLNIGIAILTWLIGREHAAPPVEVEAATAASREARNLVTGLLLIAAFTGLASFIYEIVWIRLLSLVLGSSTHSFELMLSAFILGLALGGLWIRRRIETIGNPLRFLGYVQLIMGLLALATLPLYAASFDAMAGLLRALSKTAEAYQGFTLASHLICLLVMLPATFCAGMTLPLITVVLMKRARGEHAIGIVYGANTLGSIAGVIAAVHLLIPFLGTKGALIVGSGVDIALGLSLLYVAAEKTRLSMFGASALASVVLFFGLISAADLDPLRLASGVYRTGSATLPAGTRVLSHEDGKTATITVFEASDGDIAITTNGKPDASIGPQAGTATADETTMVLSGALALAMNPHARTAANIGLGSGITTHVMLSTPQLQRVDTIEIEKAVTSASRQFGPRVVNTYNDPRSHIHVEDAKAFFSAHRTRYDIIFSEPSNPWVSGVASLFTQEFYKRIASHIADDGVFVQWLQLYEANVDITASIMKALGGEFSDYAIFNCNDTDILIVAVKQGRVPTISSALFKEPGLAKELKRVQINSLTDITARWIGDKRMLHPMFQSFGAPPNSDYFPYVDQNAARARFMSSWSVDITLLQIHGLPMVEMLGGKYQVGETLSTHDYLLRAKAAAASHNLQRAILEQRYGDLPSMANPKMLLPQLFVEACDNAQSRELWIEGLLDLTGLIAPQLSPAELAPIWSRMEKAKCFTRLTERERKWFALAQAIGRRDAQQMAALSVEILERGYANGRSPVMATYALKAGMLGNLVVGKPALAFKLWAQHGSTLLPIDNPPLDVRLLMALTGPKAYREWRSDPSIAAQ